MILDGHIHIGQGNDDVDVFLEKAASVGIEGALVISAAPNSSRLSDKRLSNEQRIDELLGFCRDKSNIYPFHWIDPLEPDALKQADSAIAKGIKGFKIICENFYPSQPKVMEFLRYVAQKDKAVLFHSGILWDGAASANYNRPAEFEAMLEVPKLRFALAHISWPWCDELIAVYGKLLNALAVRNDVSAEMFIDLTPGTPELYRREVLTKLFTVGYDVDNNIIFGSDSYARNYNCSWADEWIQRDNAIYDELGLADETRKSIYSENLKRFIGISSNTVSRKSPQQGT